MDDVTKGSNQLTIVEAVEKLEEFKQKIIDQSYEELIEEGEIAAKINLEVLDSIDALLYFINTLDQTDDNL